MRLTDLSIFGRWDPNMDNRGRIEVGCEGLTD
jgi:hypothetical protein